MRFRYIPVGLAKVAAELERLDKAAMPTLPLRRAAGYGALAGLGVHAGKRLVGASSDMPPDPSDTAMHAAATSAAGGVAVAGLLNLLNRITAKR
jgi:hypothetical protein